MQTAIGIILIIASVFLIIAVLLQHGKSHNLSGTIAGGAETFFGKTKGSTMDRKLSKLTTVVAIIFCVLVLVSYLAQDTVSPNEIMSSAQGSTLDTTDVEPITEGDLAGAEAVEGETTAETEAAAE